MSNFLRRRKHAPIEPLSAVGHNQAPIPLVDLDDPDRRATVGTDQLTYEQLDELGRELDEVRDRILHELGQSDADYIRRVIRVQLASEVAGRLLLFAGVFWWPLLVVAVATLAFSKILENMEIGHNVMHGQYDWMNDPLVDGHRYEWDNVAPAKDWKHGHNYVHHTYTNVYGMDRDIGYGLLRVADDQPWYPNHRFNLPLAFVLMVFFEWGVMYHGLELDEYLGGKISKAEFAARKKRAYAKVRRQLFKDYVAYPAVALLAVPFTSWWAPVMVLAATFVANVIRNIWTFLIIFCGHFPEGAETFAEEEAENENRGQWYFRQILGSCNITGSAPFHVMTGNLSYQIEHHAFPDIPACRYPEAARDMHRIVQKYQLRYNTGRLSKQLWSVAKQLAVYSRKPSDPYLVGNSPQSRALRKAKREAKARREASAANH